MFVCLFVFGCTEETATTHRSIGLPFGRCLQWSVSVSTFQKRGKFKKNKNLKKKKKEKTIISMRPW